MSKTAFGESQFGQAENGWGLPRLREPRSFDYQNEFRFAVQPGSTEPLRLNLGSLTDITSEILPLCELSRHVDFSSESLRDAGFSG